MIKNLKLKKKIFIRHKSEVISFKIAFYSRFHWKNILLQYIANLFLKIYFPKDGEIWEDGPTNSEMCVYDIIHCNSTELLCVVNLIVAIKLHDSYHHSQET